jgi:hypothetical protein
VLVILPIAGFECTVTVDNPPVGSDCSYWVDYPDNSYCGSANSIVECNGSNMYVSSDCGSRCPSGAGSCVTDLWGYGRCQCDGLPTWTPGAACDYFADFPSNGSCHDESTLYMCDVSNTVAAWNCASEGAGGFCGYDERLGYDWCMVPDWQWAPGYTCVYAEQYSQATCAGDTLTYCAETNVIGAISCEAQCVEWYGTSASGVCGTQPDTGYNGCVCTIPPVCDHAAYCNDSLWLVKCADDGSADQWVDCDADCRAGGDSKGVCESGDCLCG